jgi:anti-sigma-K factor RskA
MNAHEELLDSVAVYALGALSKSQAAAVRAHLRTCTECRAEYDALRPAVDALALSAEACTDGRTGPAPSALLKARVLRTVRQESRSDSATRSPGRLSWPALTVAAAAIVLAVWTAALNLILRSDLTQTHDQLAQLKVQITGTNRRLAAQKIMIADVMNADAKRFPVSGGEVIRRNDHLYIAMDGMRPPPKGHVYQAWTQSNGSRKMSASITFMPDRAGVALVSLPVNAATVAAVAVSVEPEGGSKAPTTKPEFVVKLS